MDTTDYRKLEDYFEYHQLLRKFVKKLRLSITNIKGRGADNPSTPIEGVANNTASTTLTHSDPSVTL